MSLSLSQSNEYSSRKQQRIGSYSKSVTNCDCDKKMGRKMCKRESTKPTSHRCGAEGQDDDSETLHDGVLGVTNTMNLPLMLLYHKLLQTWIISHPLMIRESTSFHSKHYHVKNGLSFWYRSFLLSIPCTLIPLVFVNPIPLPSPVSIRMVATGLSSLSWKLEF